MAVNLVSPGVNIREIDLTLGGIVPSVQNVGAIAGPFEKGPVDEPILIESEKQLIDVFGLPKTEDDQYEYWMSASNYLSYGGVLRIVRTGVPVGSTYLQNANVASVGIGSTFVRIKSGTSYNEENYNDTNWLLAAKTPGSWANGLKVCMIDNLADQTITGIGTTGFVTNTGFNAIQTRNDVEIGITTDRLVGIDTTGITVNMAINLVEGAIEFNSLVEGISTANGGTVFFRPNSTNVAVQTSTVQFGSITPVFNTRPITVGMAITQRLSKSAAIGSSVVTYDGYLRGLVTEVNANEFSVKVVDRVDPSGNSYPIDYSDPGNPETNVNAFSFDTLRDEPIYIGLTTFTQYETANVSIRDWYNSQTLKLDNSVLYWKSIANKPKTSQYALERNCKNDEVHIVVVDDTGSITGTSGNIIEKHLNLSKASDAKISPSQAVYYKDYIATYSNNIYVGAAHTGTAAYFTSSGAGSTTITTVNGTWTNPAQNTKFGCIGAKTYTLSAGNNYSINDGYNISNSQVISSYQILGDSKEYDINFLISGPSTGSNIYDAQAKANSLIAIAENRKDCIAVISPYKTGIVNVTSSTTQTENIIQFFSSLTSSSYAIFDSGYKYTLDRFNNKFVYIPCNSDIAGLIARTSANNYPWFSPAGSSRGALNNCIKLAYNPSQTQRDQLYTNRINPIIASPGAGFILFGDKTALSYSSAFDRINVRMLFLTLEKSIEQSARAQLFEFNDEITRSNFINIVEPYLRDVRAKRGITDYLVICDESNNTPDVIDSNQFKADIFVKPARSINFIGLTFVATRTGVEFSEVVGTV